MSPVIEAVVTPYVYANRHNLLSVSSRRSLSFLSPEGSRCLSITLVEPDHPPAKLLGREKQNGEIMVRSSSGSSRQRRKFEH